MRVALYRGLLFGLILLPVAAAVAQPPIPAPPPAVTVPPPSVTRDKLKTNTAALAAEVAAAKSLSEERDALRNELKALIKRLNDAPPPSPMEAPVRPGDKGDSSKRGPKIDVPVGAPDPLRAATNLVRDNQIEAALNAFRQLDLTRLAPDDRAFAKYMTASCLRRLGRTPDALAAYRTVMDDNEEPFIVSSAVSQLSLIRTSEDLQAQLTKLRERPKSR